MKKYVLYIRYGDGYRMENIIADSFTKLQDTIEFVRNGQPFFWVTYTNLISIELQPL